MAEGTKTLDKARALIEERLAELNAETKRLEQALSNLKGERRGPGRPRSSTQSSRTGSSGSGGGKRRRRRRGGTRAEHALKAVKANPGITASQIAEKLKIKPNYVYRVMSDLTEDGKVSKDGRGYTAT
jgi:sugar-specific transcriptional regulator TrmB